MFKNAIDIFEVFGFKIRVDPSWFIIAALIIWSLSTSYFPEQIPDLGQYDYIGISVVAMFGLFASLLLHELSHSLVARLYGLNVGSITLFIFGGVAELEKDPQSAKSEFWIAIAGPIMSFALAGSFYLIVGFISIIEISLPIQALFNYLALINLVIAIFNMVPAFPLDGGRVLRAAIWHFKNDLMVATRIASRMGRFFALLLMGLGIVTLFSSQFVSGLWQIMIGGFIWMASKSTYNDLVVRQILKNHTVSSLMTRDLRVADVNETVQTIVEKIMLKRNTSFIPVMEGEHLLGYVDAAMIQTIDKENWKDTKLADIYTSANDSNTVTPGAKIEDVFDQMVQTGCRKLLVARGGELEGIITLSDLMTYLAIRHELGLANKETPAIRQDNFPKHVHQV